LIRLNFRKLVKKMMIAFGCIFLVLLAVFLANISIWHRIEKVPERDLHFPRGESSVTWIGHSTLLLHLDNVNIITDPMYSDYILLFAKRYYEPAVKFEKLPPIDLICISHEHYDHLDKATLKRFPKDIPVVISKGIGYKVRDIGFTDVRELKWWQSTVVKGVRITAVPGKHGGARISGYVIEGAKTIYFAGDTAFFDAFYEIGRKFKIDVALMPISHYRSRNGNPRVDKMLKTIHMGPGDFPEAIKALGTKLAIPIHYKTFKNVGSFELPLEEPERYLREIIKRFHLEKSVKILELGEQINLNSLDKK
jgi:L-ascorbate metabolism protein UlaG (beta-lactamase superfamily)